MKTDIQIAQEASMLHIKDVAEKLGIKEEELDEILEPLHMTEPGISAKELLKKRNEGI